MLKGFARVERTNSGKTGIGLEVEVNGMRKYSDLTAAQKDYFKSNGYRWMKAKYEEKDGEWVKVREGFFYKSFETKKARDEEYKKLIAKLVKDEPKAEPKKAAAKKATPKAKKAEPKKSLEKMTKKELLEYIATLA